MTTLTTALPAVIGYLVATAPTFVPAGTQVFDGPPAVKAVMSFSSALWIGHDPASPGDVAAETEQDWPNLDQGRTVDETGTITCTARAWSGDTTIATQRAAAAAIAGSVEEMLRGTQASGGPGDTTMGGLAFWSHVTAGQWLWGQLPAGAEAWCVFKVVYYARLTAD